MCTPKYLWEVTCLIALSCAVTELWSPTDLGSWYLWKSVGWEATGFLFFHSDFQFCLCFCLLNTLMKSVVFANSELFWSLFNPTLFYCILLQMSLHLRDGGFSFSHNCQCWWWNHVDFADSVQKNRAERKKYLLRVAHAVENYFPTSTGRVTVVKKFVQHAIIHFWS